MPTVLREKRYRFYFVMFDLNEPIQVHVDNGRKTAKYWLTPVRIARTHGYRVHELNEIESIIDGSLQRLLVSWDKEKAKLK